MATQGFISSLCLLILVTSTVHIEARGGNAIKQRDLNEVDKAKPKKPSPRQPDVDLPATTTWAILVAGSNGYENYRHQADACHAYQVLKKGGLKDENIIVFMYDDIANNENNPNRGIIINRPRGKDVYAGVPKDYTGKYATVQNFYNVLLGNTTAVKGGSGKVVKSKPNDRIFIFYSDHGGPGVLTMPNPPSLLAKDFIEILKQKHASGNYKEMVIYVEACEAGSIFEGLLPQNMNIYVTTASNAVESSYATYCDSQEYDTCLGDLYSVAWMEQSDSINRKTEKLKDQYLAVRERTSQNHTYEDGSHVMEYGEEVISEEMVYLYQGYDPTASTKLVQSNDQHFANKEVVNSQDASLLFLWNRYKASKDGSMEKTSYLKQLTDEIKHRNHLEGSIKLIGHLLFGPAKHNSIINSVREAGSPLVDDWDCYKSMIRLFETHCGSLSRYGLKHARAFANICNNGVRHAAMEEATVTACSGHDLGKWNPLEIGYTA